MSVLCAIGIHRWKPHHRMLPEARREQLMIPVIPELFSGPPFLAPTGIFFAVLTHRVSDVCSRCRKRRPA